MLSVILLYCLFIQQNKEGEGKKFLEKNYSHVITLYNVGHCTRILLKLVLINQITIIQKQNLT